MTPAPTSAPPQPLIRLGLFRVRDFRCVEDVALDLDETTVVIGENNVGKTAIVEALAIALGDRFASTADFRVRHDGTSVERFLVDLRLEPAGSKQFADDVVDLFTQKAIRADSTGQNQVIPIRVVGKPDPTGRSVKLSRGFLTKWDAPVNEQPEGITAAQLQALSFALLDAQRDLAADLRQRSSPWGKLLRRLKLDKTKRQELEDKLFALASEIVAESPEAKRLETALTGLTSALAGVTDPVRLAVIPHRLEDLWRTTELLVGAASQPALSIGVQGMGARSLGALLAFRAFLETELLGLADAPMMVVTAFEEPEAHLHPQAQRAVMEQLDAVPGQKLISTHSPFAASMAKPDSFRVLKRGALGVSVKSAAGISTDSTLDEKKRSLLQRFCISRNGEMLFARLVVLFEGDTEAGVLPRLARVWWDAWPERKGVSFVPVDGADNMPTFAGYLSRLGVPWLAFLDGDGKGLEVQTKLQALPGGAANTFVIKHLGNGVDIEGLLSQTARAAIIRALGGDHPEMLVAESDADLAKRLRGKKAWFSQTLADEIVVDWTNRILFPQFLQEVFGRADTLLKGGS